MIHEELRHTVAGAAGRAKADCIALSGGLDSSILGYHMTGTPGVSVIAQDFVASDLTYCQLASKRLGLPLEMITAGSAQLLDAARQTVRILGHFNDIEIRNSIVMYTVIQHVRSRGLKSVVTGDGADELFAGYDFMVRPGADLQAQRARMRNIMHFPSTKIGQALGVRVLTPYLDDDIVRLASDLPDSALVGEHEGRRYGKLILRQAYQDRIPSGIVWRPKAAIQDGSGTAGLTGLFESIISQDAFDARASEILESDGVRIRTRESLHYYEIYRDIFGVPRADPESGCPYCRHRVPDGSEFCRMCGAYPV